jgi:hypothetical protein
MLCHESEQMPALPKKIPNGPTAYNRLKQKYLRARPNTTRQSRYQKMAQKSPPTVPFCAKGEQKAKQQNPITKSEGTDFST